MNGALGRYIRVSRRGKGLTLRQLGSAIGVHFTVVSRWERLKLHVPEAMVGRLAEGLSVPVEDLQARWVPPDDLPAACLEGISRRGRRYLPTYPVKGTLDEMLASGERARDAYRRALEAEPSLAIHEEIRDAVPRDSPLELQSMYEAVAGGATLVFCCLLDLGFRKNVVLKETERYVGDVYRHAFLLRHERGILLLVPQVSMLVLSQSRERRADFLLLYTSGRDRIWADLEMDGGLQDRDANDDARRAYGLGLLRISRTRKHVESAGFLPGLLWICERALDERRERRARGRRRAAA